MYYVLSAYMCILAVHITSANAPKSEYMSECNGEYVIIRSMYSYACMYIGGVGKWDVLSPGTNLH